MLQLKNYTLHNLVSLESGKVIKVYKAFSFSFRIEERAMFHQIYEHDEYSRIWYRTNDNINKIKENDKYQYALYGDTLLKSVYTNEFAYFMQDIENNNNTQIQMSLEI